MGLDMYLKAEQYVSGFKHSPSTETELFEKIRSLTGIHPTDRCPSIEVRATVIYWRKANAIHNWFVEKVQKGVDDCGDYLVRREDLESLRDDCQAVLDDPEAAKTKLPTTSGFFFGSTEYDEGYLEDLRYTVEHINRVLNCPKMSEGAVDFYYRSSW